MQTYLVLQAIFLIFIAFHFVHAESYFSNLFKNWSEKKPNRNITAVCGRFRGSEYFNLERTIKPSEFPWMATIIHRSQRYESLGVLIAEQYILTPAHVFNEDSDPSSYIVHLGSCRLKGKCTQSYDVELFKQHDKYIRDKTGDNLSVLRLKEPITISEDIQPICLPSLDVKNSNFVTQHLLMTGRHLRGSLNAKFFVLIQPLNICRRSFIELGAEIDERVVCASTCDNGSSYVSGSALMAVASKDNVPDHYYLVGLLAGGKSGCTDSSPDIFLRIDPYVDWIVEYIAKLDSTQENDGFGDLRHKS